MSTSPDSTVHGGIEVSNLSAITRLVDEEKNRKGAGKDKKSRRKPAKKQQKPGPVPHDEAQDGLGDGCDEDDPNRPTIDYLA